ncbi:MAG: N-acetylgalactosamine-6-sulfatase, partial [Lentisphaerae bacterium]
MKNTLSWLTLTSLASTLCAGQAEERNTMAECPNIVFIFADDLGWGDLSAHGHPWLKTPNIDRLIKEGIDFQQFNVLNPVCSPSRVAVMTGHYPARYCINQHFADPKRNHQRNMPDWLDPRAPTLPRFLKQAGYRTGHFGKWHLTNTGVIGAPLPNAYGLDEFAVFNGGSDWPENTKCTAEPGDVAERTVQFIRRHRKHPFFVNVWLHEVHTPHIPSSESMQRWAHLGEQKQVYAAVVTDMDNAVGKILATLDAEGLTRKT